METLLGVTERAGRRSRRVHHSNLIRFSHLSKDFPDKRRLLPGLKSNQMVIVKERERAETQEHLLNQIFMEDNDIPALDSWTFLSQPSFLPPVSRVLINKQSSSV